MEAITFDTEYAKKLELAISLEFGCRTSEIVSLRDSLVKKVIVYILFERKKCNARVISANYQISYLYVPTVVVEIEYMLKVVPGFELKLNRIYESINCNEKANCA